MQNGICREFTTVSDPAQYASKDHHEHHVYPEQRADDHHLATRRPVVAQKGHHKKRNVNGYKYGERSPPGVDPDKSRCLREEDLYDAKEGSVSQGKRNTIGDSKDTHPRILGSNFESTTPAIENIKLSSMPTPTRIRKAVPVGTVQRA